ncbi:MAG: glycosyltransferase N-terminal domain-containing protein [Gemmatimonadota bacterium]
MAKSEAVYTMGLRLLRGALPLVSRGEGKLARGVRGRRGAGARLARWASAAREARRGLVWFHAPSVGEGLQAQAVMEALRVAAPDLQIAYTYFSPSAERLADRFGADVADYLPIDLPDEVGPVLDALRPSALVFSKTEVWPNLTREAVRRGIPVLLLSATLPEGSSRLRWPTRTLLTSAHSRLTIVGAISPADAARYQALGVPAERIVVMGDARFDQVARRAATAGASASLLEEIRDPRRLTIVAGSTWSEDEDLLIAAFASLPGAGERERLIVVPHEPSEPHLRQLEQRAARAGLGAVRLSRFGEPGDPGAVLIVDRLGVLGDLYGLADIAYVGGGFGSAGLHSILEPAAFGIPVLYGPQNSNAREASGMVVAGGGFVVRDQLEFGRRLAVLAADRHKREAAGAAARANNARGTGAAASGARLINEAMDIASG